MKHTIVFGFVIIGIIFLFGCTVQQPTDEVEINLADEENEPVEQIDPPSLEIDAGPADTEIDSVADDLQAVVVLADEKQPEEQKIKAAVSQPKKLANNYYRYDKEHFEQSLSEGKTIFIDFHANWCPICKREHPHIFAAFNELNNPNVVGYQAHYNDDQTNEEDKEAIEKYNIRLQHTKIVINGQGEEVSRSLEEFDKAKVLEEIGKA